MFESRTPMTTKEFLSILGVVLLALTIGFSPSITVAQLADGRAVEIRAEDILISLLLIFSIFSFLIYGKNPIKIIPLFYLIGAWLGINVLSIVANVFFNNLYITRSFFFFLKEVQFFVIFLYVFFYVKSINAVKFLMNTWIFIGLVSALWIIYEIVTGSQYAYHYGPNTFIEPEGTISSGGFYLLIFLFLFNVFLHYYSDEKIPILKKSILFLIIILPAVGVFSSGSRAALMGFIPAFGFSLLVYLIKKKVAHKNLLLVFNSVLVVIILFSITYINAPFLQRFTDIDSATYELESKHSVSRISIWRDQLKYFLDKPLFLPIGFGTGVVLKYGESHSQYVRNLVEVGIIGTIIAGVLLAALVKESLKSYRSKDNFVHGISIGFLSATIAMLFISLTTEPFIIVKVAEVYWFFTGLTMVSIYIFYRSVGFELKSS